MTKPNIADHFIDLDTSAKANTIRLFMSGSRLGRGTTWYNVPPTCPVGDRDLPYTVDLPVGIAEDYVAVQEWAHAELTPAGHAYAYEAVNWIDPNYRVHYGAQPGSGDEKASRTVWRWSFDDLKAATLFKLRWVG